MKKMRESVKEAGSLFFLFIFAIKTGPLIEYGKLFIFKEELKMFEKTKELAKNYFYGIVLKVATKSLNKNGWLYTEDRLADRIVNIYVWETCINAYKEDFDEEMKSNRSFKYLVHGLKHIKSILEKTGINQYHWNENTLASLRRQAMVKYNWKDI